MTDSFFERVQEPGNFKHKVLERYLHIWVSKLASKFDSLAFVDTCAGAGTYENGQPGSPVLAAQWNDHNLLAGKDPPKTLQVHACETQPQTVEQLRTALRPWTSRRPPIAFIYQKSFVEVLPQLVEATRSMPRCSSSTRTASKTSLPTRLSPY